MRGIVLLFLFFYLSGCSEPALVETKALAVNGKIDLSAHDFSRSALVNLSGNWEFYTGRLIGPTDFIKDKSLMPDTSAPVPGNWNDLKSNGKRLSPAGCATYRLVITVPGNVPVWGFKLRTMFTSYRLYVNGQLALTNGVVSTDPAVARAEYKPLLYYYSFPDKSVRDGKRALELVLQVANYLELKGGVAEPVVLGTAQAVNASRGIGLAFDFLVLGAIAVMGIYHLGLFFLRHKDRSALYFGLFCLVIGLRLLTLNETRTFYQLPGLPWEWGLRVEYLTFYLSPLLFTRFLETLYGGKLSQLANRAILVISLACGLLVLLAPTTVYLHTAGFFRIFTLACGVFISTVIISAFLRKRDGAPLFFAGFLILFAAVINDVLYAFDVIRTGYMIQYALFIFIFIQAFFLSTRFARAYRMAEELTMGLENMVADRTAELEVERNRLKQQNQLMMGELQLAHKIQMEFIPRRSPNPQIAFYYKPMEQVGGDFFDFIELPGGKTGIIISDVSGHGVSAAFVTSMIKSFTLQFAPIIDNPAEFLMMLNDFVFNLTSGNFITAFYSIYNPANRELFYANAGHNAPYVVQKTRAEFLDHKNRGMPLAVLDNREMTNLGKAYQNQTITLRKGTRLFLYTDGLLECVNMREKQDYSGQDIPDFESARLREAFAANFSLPAGKFLEKIAEQLVAYRGGGNFDDDVCMICLDVI